MNFLLIGSFLGLAALTIYSVRRSEIFRNQHDALSDRYAQLEREHNALVDHLDLICVVERRQWITKIRFIKRAEL